MKKSDIRKIIKEEVVNLIREQYLTEAFADPKLAMINKLGGLDRGWKRTFWDAAANTYDLEWDKLPKGTLQRMTPLNPLAIKDGMMTFWIVKTPKDNPFRTGYTSYTVQPGVLAVTLGGKIQYYSRDGIGGKDASSKYAGGAVGKAERGQLMTKKLKQLADEVYTFNLGNFRGGTTALKAKRAELKLGKDTFQNAKAWKQANLARYKDILDARVGSRDQVDAMVAKIVKIANEAIQSGTELTKVGRYGDLVTTLNDKEVRIESVTNAMTRVLRMYAEYIRYENEEERSQGDYGAEYNRNRKRDVAGKIKKALNALEAGDERNIEYI